MLLEVFTAQLDSITAQHHSRPVVKDEFSVSATEWLVFDRNHVQIFLSLQFDCIEEIVDALLVRQEI